MKCSITQGIFNDFYNKAVYDDIESMNIYQKAIVKFAK